MDHYVRAYRVFSRIRRYRGSRARKDVFAHGATVTIVTGWQFQPCGRDNVIIYFLLGAGPREDALARGNNSNDDRMELVTVKINAQK
jgi:hypothetical protein